MKKFIFSFLGSMAAIWLSVLLFGLLLFFTVAKLLSSATPDISIEKHSVLKIDLEGEVIDRDTPLDLMSMLQDGGSSDQLSLNDMVNAIEHAKTDNRIDGIYLNCGDASIGLAQCQALITALESFRRSGKFVWAYSDSYSQSAYFVATAADKVLLNPVGMVDIHGLSAQTLYFKELLDKLGVEVQVVKVGTYKSAVEPFILNTMSEANREQQTVFLESIWKRMSADIANRRKVAADSVNAWANAYSFARPADYYTSHGIVDSLLYRRQVDDQLAQATEAEKGKPAFVELSNYITETKLKRKLAGGDKKIAVLYAVGDITESGSQGIASDRLVPEILSLIDDESIDGLIMRVNSGGGSAFASEQIWEALEQWKAQTSKPFYVSMGDMAASGGYYISCGADRIYAEPFTLTGSIGIFGMIPNIQPLLRDKLGVNIEQVTTNTGSFPSITAPMPEGQRQAMQDYVDRGYELFVSRCAAGRDVPVDSIKAIAEGRVWDGINALSIGLVDQLGGLDSALADMASALGTTVDKVQVADYPEVEHEWWQVLLDMDSEVAAAISGTQPLTLQAAMKTLHYLRSMNPIQCRTNIVYLK